MLGPRLTDHDFTERAGVVHVESVVTTARCVWRETPLRDVGIDGQIEYVTPEGEATGRVVAVQVKSGDSYFRAGLAFRVAERHQRYWESFALPVILVLHRPQDGLALWVDARAALRRGENPVRVPSINVLDASGVFAALESTGPLPTGVESPDGLISKMVSERHAGVSFLDLFVHGMTDVAYSLYFNMDLVSVLLEHRAWQSGVPSWGVAHATYEFLDRYVAFIVAHDIARVDFDAWSQTQVERQMIGLFMAPLTQRGRAVVAAIIQLNARLVPGNGAVIRERAVQMVIPDMGERTDAADRLSKAIEGCAHAAQ